MPSRRAFLQTPAAAILLRNAARSAETAIDAGVRKQLFIDRRFIAKSRGIRLRTHPPRKAGPVLRREKPWERDHIGSYLSVIEHDGLYKMWYMSFAGKSGPNLCYATSADGIAWERPLTRVREFEGSRDNNIVITPFKEGAVMLDPIAPPEYRFKTLASFGGKRPSALGTSRSGSLMLVTSPDGIHWTREFDILPLHPDSMNCLFWDDRVQKYAAYLRGWNPLRVVVRDEIARDRILGRWPYTPAEKPRYLWSFLKDDWPPAISTELPTVIAADELDPLHCDIYTPNVQPYPWAQDVYFAFPSLFRHTAAPGSEKIPVPMAGVLDVQIAASRDGIRWDRLDRRPYVPLGVAGEIDSKGNYMGLGMIRRRHEIWQYYAGGSGDHGGEKGDSAIFRTVQRLDGFVSVRAETDGGEFLTPPVQFSGRRLILNVDTSASGVARVELLDRAGRAVPGYEMRNCRPIVANDVAHEVNWANGPDLGHLAPGPISLRFELRNADLFAFQFVPDSR